MRILIYNNIYYRVVIIAVSNDNVALCLKFKYNSKTQRERSIILLLVIQKENQCASLEFPTLRARFSILSSEVIW